MRASRRTAQADHASQSRPACEYNLTNQIMEKTARAMGTWVHWTRWPNCSGVWARDMATSPTAMPAMETVVATKRRWTQRLRSPIQIRKWIRPSINDAEAPSKEVAVIQFIQSLYASHC